MYNPGLRHSSLCVTAANHMHVLPQPHLHEYYILRNHHFTEYNKKWKTEIKKHKKWLTVSLAF